MRGTEKRKACGIEIVGKKKTSWEKKKRGCSLRDSPLFHFELFVNQKLLEIISRFFHLIDSVSSDVVIDDN